LSWESFSDLMDERNRVGRSYLIYNDEPLLSASRSPGDDLVVGDTANRRPPKDRAALFVPIESRVGKIVGFLLVEDPKEGVRPSLETIQTLEIFANQVAVVIENQRLFAEAKQKTRELEILNEKLRGSKEDIEAFAKKLEESNRELEKVNAELLEADRFKAEFLQNITHELKTPIAPIIINSDMLLSRRLGELEERQEEVLKSINQSGKRLNELIMDLLYLSRMEDGKLEFVMEAIDAGVLLGSSLREIAPLAREKGITLDEFVEDGVPPIRGDERHLIQLLTNLLRNAVKFTAEGGTVSCRARQAESNGSRVELEVSDTGIGIPEAGIHKIFDRFYQVDGSSTRKYQGAGLGLAIVKKIVEAHDGEIDILSKVGEGSTFRVRLPAHNGYEETDAPGEGVGR
jgi:signal transduction histidine kinase